MDTRSVIGIDFGTTTTSVVRIMKNEYGTREYVMGEVGENTSFCSMLFLDRNNGVEIGSKVKRNRSELAQRGTVFSSFKSLLGTDEKLIANGVSYSARQIVAEYLSQVVAHIQQVYGVHIRSAAFSFPVGFTPAARRDLKAAAKMAGIHVSTLISEPTAAYLSCLQETRGASRVMVIDWGGGTLDISILDVERGRVREVSVFGEKIGGDDIDREMAQRLHARLNNQVNDPAQRLQFSEMPPAEQDKMIAQCEDAKIELSNTGENISFVLNRYGSYGTIPVAVSFSLFTEIVRPIIESRVMRSIDIALARAGLSTESIDKVIIAGGSSNLSPYENAIVKIFGMDKLVRPDGFQFVSARGAAMAALNTGRMLLGDDVCLQLSDNSLFPIFHRERDGVGSKSGDYTFSLVEDAPDAHFIFTNGDGTRIYQKTSVPTKGFFQEQLRVSAQVDDDQVVRVSITNTSMGEDNKTHEVELSELPFLYNLPETER